MGIETGSIKVAKRTDVVIMDEEFEVFLTLVKGSSLQPIAIKRRKMLRVQSCLVGLGWVQGRIWTFVKSDGSSVAIVSARKLDPKDREQYGADVKMQRL